MADIGRLLDSLVGRGWKAQAMGPPGPSGAVSSRLLPPWSVSITSFMGCILRAEIGHLMTGFSEFVAGPAVLCGGTIGPA
jgi:hypothetical protein